MRGAWFRRARRLAKLAQADAAAELCIQAGDRSAERSCAARAAAAAQQQLEAWEQQDAAQSEPPEAERKPLLPEARARAAQPRQAEAAWDVEVQQPERAAEPLQASQQREEQQSDAP